MNQTIEPSFNTWAVFFLTAVVQGLFLTAMIMVRKSRVNNILGFLILSFSVCLISYVGYWTNYIKVLPFGFGVLTGLTYTFGPLLYFYIRSSKKEIFVNSWHFVPFLLFAVFFFSLKIKRVEWIIAIQPVIQCAHLLIYTFLIYQFISNNKGYTNGALKLYTWRKKVALAFSGYTLSFLLYYLLVWTGTLEIEYDYMISVASSFFIYFIGYHGFQHQEVFKMYENSKYDKSGLTNAASKSILAVLRGHMEKEHSYLDSSLKLQNLAEKLQLSSHHISQVINDIEGKNFADFVNEYRIGEAKKLLLDSEMKVIEVAYNSGFNNKTSFNSAFKKFTGFSPSEYKNSQKVLP